MLRDVESRLRLIQYQVVGNNTPRLAGCQEPNGVEMRGRSAVRRDRVETRFTMTTLLGNQNHLPKAKKCSVARFSGFAAVELTNPGVLFVQILQEPEVEPGDEPVALLLKPA